MSTTKLPPLVCGIFRNGELIDVAEQPDPRDGFVRHYNELSERSGLSARPLTNDEIEIARNLLNERQNVKGGGK